MRIIIIADNASNLFGGEALIPLNLFRLLRARNMDVKLIVHARNRTELTRQFPSDLDRLFFVEDTFIHKGLFRFGALLPRRLAESTTGFLIHLTTQLSQRRVLHEIKQRSGIDIIHVPTPVSPKIPSLVWNIDAAVVMGPLNGGMEYPIAFRQQQRFVSRMAMSFARWLASFANMIIPGKRYADVVLVANRRTREAVPRGIKGEIVHLVENGVDFSVWHKKIAEKEQDGTIRFIFIGRLIDWKAVDIVLEAMHRLRVRQRIVFEVVGDGAMLERWRSLADALGLGSAVQFSGWMSQQHCALRLQQADVFVLPSLFECGGAVVLEAMATGLPVIATAWGGPVDYLDASCGILVEPSSRESLIAGFVDGMEALANSPELRARLGQAGHARARQYFDWDRKIDQLISIYEKALKSRKPFGPR